MKVIVIYPLNQQEISNEKAKSILPKCLTDFLALLRYDDSDIFENDSDKAIKVVVLLKIWLAYQQQIVGNICQRMLLLHLD